MLTEQHVYTLLLVLFEKFRISPVIAIPAMRKLANDAERIMAEEKTKDATDGFDDVRMVH